MLLVLSLVLFFVLVPLLENSRIGGMLLVVNMYATLLAATMQLEEKPSLFRCAAAVGAVSMVLVLASHLYTARSLYIANSLVLAVFFGLVSVSLFLHLGETGRVTRSRLFASVGLYLLLGLTFFALFSFLNAVQPGSFAESGVVLNGRLAPSKLLYFSLTNLTTLGYGDIVAIKPAARMVAPLEAATGVLYVAITVARLVAGYQRAYPQQSARQSREEAEEELTIRRH